MNEAEHQAVGEHPPGGWKRARVAEFVTDWAVGPRFPGDLYAKNGNVATLRTTDMDEEGNIDRSTMPRAQLAAAAFRPHYLQADDLVISRSGTCGITGVFKGHDLPVVPGAFLIRFRFNGDVLPLYIKYVWNSPLGRQRLLREAEGGVQKNLRGTSVLRVEFDFPPLREQRKIAKILTTVDNLIEKTEALIAKYQAIKQGMMHDLFTRGVDSRGHLRPTHDEAPELYKESELGWIRKEWDQTTVGRSILGIDAGKSPDCPDIPAPPGEWGVLKVSAVQPDGFRSGENKIVMNRALVNPSYEVYDGDLLISRSNTYQLVGIVCFVRSPQPRLMLCDKTLRLRCDPRCANTEFLFWLLQQPFVRNQIEIHATGTSGSMKNISQSVIRSLVIALPATDEQDRITSRIRSLQHAIEAERRTQAKLKTQKTGLMQDLLTGKVRVNVDESEEAAV